MYYNLYDYNKIIYIVVRLKLCYLCYDEMTLMR